MKKSKGTNNIDGLVYPEIQCQQIIQFDSWCRCICPFINNNRGIIYVGNDKGKFYSFNTSWSLKAMKASLSRTSLKSTLSATTLDTSSVLYGSKSSNKVRTIYVNDRKSSPVYNIEYYSKFHRLSIIFMLFVSNTNYIITLSSDHTLQVHDANTCDALFGVRNPEHCRYTSADYNHEYQELYVVGIYLHIFLFLFSLFIIFS